MKNAIWKFELFTTEEQQVMMPAGARLLCVQTQRDAPCLWAEVNTDAGAETRRFRIFGTGGPLTIGVRDVYIGTYQLHGGSLVFHVYEVAEQEVGG